MSFLYKRGKYWWYGDGKVRRNTKATSKDTAKLIQNKWDNENALRQIGILKPQLKTVQELIFEWSHFKELTIRNRISLNHFINFVGPQKYIHTITTKTINEFILSRKKEGKAPNTISNDLIPIKQLFNYAWDNEYIERNPVIRIISPGRKVKQIRTAIPEDEIQEIFKIAKENDRIYWMVCYYTGLSPVDAGTLKPEYITDNVIYTTRSKTKVLVPIPLHPKLIELGQRIFNCMTTKSYRDHSNRRFKKICAERGYYGVVYSLRHSFVSHLFDLGLGLEDIKVVAGHTSSLMTSHYTHAQVDTIKKVLKKLK